MSGLKQVHLVIDGDVTGVGFRAWTKRQAEKFGITGWVRNIDAGKVEVVGQGDVQHLEDFVARCRRGPDIAWVENVSVRWEASREIFPDFQIQKS